MPDKFTRKNLKLIQDAQKGLIKGLSNVQKAIIVKILALSKNIPTIKGKFNLTPENFAVVNEIADQINQVIAASGYPNKIRPYLRNFDEIDRNTAALHKSVNGLDVAGFIKQNPAKAILTQKTLTNLTGAGINQAFVQPVKDLLIESAMAGTSLTDFEDALRFFVQGDADKLGTLERYVGQVARDSLSQYNGAIQNEIRKEYDLQNFRYVGGEVDDTRPVCHHIVTTFGDAEITIEELEVILGEFIPSGVPSRETTTDTVSGKSQRKGAGMIPGTNIDNFFMHRGGYNCLHSTIPVE